MNRDIPVLKLCGLTIRFGDARIVEDLDFECLQGSVTVLTGPNAAGKTTVLNVISGLVGWASGSIAIEGVDVPRPWTPHAAFAKGVRRTFQVPRNWASLDLVENINMGSDRNTSEIKRAIEQAISGVEPTRSPAMLSFGQRRLLEMLRLCMTRGQSRLALLDEPLSGLDAANARLVADWVAKLRSDGAAVLVVDHEPNNWPACDAMVPLGIPSH